MFFNQSPFFATCPCNKIQFLNNEIQSSWENVHCQSCTNKLIVYKDRKLICNFNKDKFLATCDCTNVKLIKHKILEIWFLRKCNKCDSKLRVYNDNGIEIQYDGVKKALCGSCKCGHVSHYSNYVNLGWEKVVCVLCSSKLIVTSSKNKEIICDFNSETFNPRSEVLFTAICACGSYCKNSNHVLKKWKNKVCNTCNSHLFVYHNLRKIKWCDYNYQTSESNDEYLSKMETIPFASLSEIEGNRF